VAGGLLKPICHPERSRIARDPVKPRDRFVLENIAPAGKNLLVALSAVNADSRSFDSVNRLASESVHSAQDDNDNKTTNLSPTNSTAGLRRFDKPSPI